MKQTNIPPILIIAFNRPQHFRQILDVVLRARPKKIYIAIDGPRKSNFNDDSKRADEIKSMISEIPLTVEIHKRYQEHNLGCKLGVSSAITWFFENEEMGVILEDDCLPSHTFFRYCNDLLIKYRTEEAIMHISGVNFQDGIVRGKSSYYFSKMCHVWGWASWRRAWNRYDISMLGLEEFFDSGSSRSIIVNEKSMKYWKNALTKTKNNLINTWDYQWVFSIWKHNGLCIAPNKNLISNIGFDELATHTKLQDNRVSRRNLDDFEEDIIHPRILAVNYEADLYSLRKLFVSNRTFYKRIVNKLKKIFN